MFPSEMLRKQVLAVGKRLIDALGAAQDLAASDRLDTGDGIALEEWKESWREVDRLAERYRSLVERFREALEEEFARGRPT